MENLEDVIELVKGNEVILQSYLKTNAILKQYSHPLCSVSGGRDSDIMLDIVHRLDTDKKVTYVWFDTGVEYKATREHILYLEQRYGIVIKKAKALKPIPITCKQFGQPFLSKLVSGHIEALQKNGFQWENDTYENLIEKYQNCKSAIAWWTNHNPCNKYNIEYNKFLKEFLMTHPPTFPISDRCCQYAKKDVSHKIEDDINCDLRITGIRKYEGGVRSIVFKDCFTDNRSIGATSALRPLFWYTNADETEYDKIFDIKHSDCYEVYGYKRTGCAGCPFNKEFEEDVKIMEKFEPNLARMANNVFKESYEYSKLHNMFVRERRDRYSKVKSKAKEDFDYWYWQGGGCEEHHWKKHELNEQRNKFIERRLKENKDEIHK